MSPWILHDEPELTVPHLICMPLRQLGLSHGFSLKPRHAEGAIAEEGPPLEFLHSLGLQETSPAKPRQVHGKVVAGPGLSPGSTDPERADAVVSSGSESSSSAIATADCVGAILSTPEDEGYAVVHAGWRGTLAGIIPEAVKSLEIATGRPAGTFLLAMGPSIGGCCYEVGGEVAERFRSRFKGINSREIFGLRNGKTTLDLPSANRALALEAGLDPNSIYTSGVCTSCRSDICWSYRVQGAQAGRMWVVAGRAPGSRPYRAV